MGNFDNLNDPELRKEAAELGVENTGDMSREELEQAVTAALTDGAQPEEAGQGEGGEEATDPAPDEAQASEWVNPGPPTSPVPVPADQPGRLGGVEPDPPDNVAFIRHASKPVDDDE